MSSRVRDSRWHKKGKRHENSDPSMNGTRHEKAVHTKDKEQDASSADRGGLTIPTYDPFKRDPRFAIEGLSTP